MIILLVVAGTLAAARLLNARSHLLRGAALVQGRTHALSAPGAWTSPQRRADTQRTLRRAQHQFAAAHDDLAPLAPLLNRLGWVPGVGPELAVVAPATDAALYSTASAGDILDGLRPVWKAAATAGSNRMERLAGALLHGNPSFRLARGDADRANSALSGARSAGVSRPLRRPLADLRRTLPPLRAAATWLEVLPRVLGMRRPSRVLVAIQDPREIRATGGFIGAADLLTLRQGHLSHRFSSSELPNEITSVPPPVPEAEYTNEAYWLFRDSNWSPHGPLSARLERWFYGKDTGIWADGVVNVTSPVMQRLLTLTGPVYLSQYRRWVSSAHVQGLSDEYVNGTYHGPSAAGSRDTVRKQFLGFLVSALTKRLAALPVGRWPALGEQLAQAVTRREIMIYYRAPDIEEAIVRSGADGRFTPVRGDSLAVVDDNRSYNKINPYVDEHLTHVVTVHRDGTLDAVTTIRYALRPSPPGIEGAGPDFGQEGGKHDYEDFLRVFVPRGATLRSLTGLDRWAPQPAYGRTQFAGRLLIREGQKRTVTVRYTLPAAAWRTGDGHYTLHIWRQPGTPIRSVGVTVAGTDGVTIGLPGGGFRPRTAQTVALSRDSSLTLRLRGISPAPGDHLPTAVWADPYIPYRSLRDPKHPL